MIKVVITKRDDLITELDLSGHAEFREHPFDTVCAGVSCIIFGLMNALDKVNDIKVLENHINIKLTSTNQIEQNYLNLVYIQLKTIEYKYKKYINIKIRKE